MMQHTLPARSGDAESGHAPLDLSRFETLLPGLDLMRWRGVITDVTGFVIESKGPSSPIGGFCEIRTANGRTIRTQVAGVSEWPHPFPYL